jgi:hypothetical protein
MSVEGEEFTEITKDHGRSFLPDLVVAYHLIENER